MANSKSTPNVDRRKESPAQAQVTPERQIAAGVLGTRLDDVRIDYDPVTGTPAWISKLGYLSKTTDEEIQRTGDLGLTRDDPHRAIKAFLIENTALFEHGADVLNDATITREFVAEHNGMRTVVWQQRLDGIPVFESILIGHVTRDGRLVNISSHFLPDVEKASGLGEANRLLLASEPAISGAQAVATALSDLGDAIAVEAVTLVNTVSTPDDRQTFTANPLLGEASAKLVWLPMNRSSIRLCWCVQFMSRSKGEGFQTLVDATSGEVIVRQNRTCNFLPASYRVYPSDSPSPFTPGWSTPSSTQPSVVNRQLMTLAALSQTASPDGWIRDYDNLTLGNNVDSSANWNGQIPNPTPRPQGNPFRVFDLALDLNDDPSVYADAAAVNLFYWCNLMHDKLYLLGFTEAAGNFQDDNFGRGGVPGDRVLAYAQWPGANNAYFETWPDGTSGVMRMYRFTSPSPNRDSALDAEVILHEYTHGLSNRRVGGGVGITELQSRGLGEGWSDFYAMSLLSQSGDNVSGNYPAGGYVTYQLAGLTENYYYGIRRYPYSIAMNKNPLTFKDIDPNQFDNCSSGAPFNTVLFVDCASVDASEEHNVGEVWCVTLWEVRAKLIGRYGPAGNTIMLQLVTDGMNLCPPNPNFIQARDAFFEAVLVSNYCSSDWGRLWEGFSKRGMGGGATAPDSSTTSGVVESFDGGPPSPCQE